MRRSRCGLAWGLDGVVLVRGSVPRATGLLPILMVVMGFVLWGGVGVGGVARGATMPPDQQQKKISEAISRLKTEAKMLDNLKSVITPVFSRPHPVLRGFGDELSLAILQEMLKKIMPNEYRDVYVKWHLMAVIQQMKPMDRKESGDRFVRLVQSMPGPLVVERRREYVDEPADIAAQWWALWRKSMVTVGYPPFTRNYYGRSAVEHAVSVKKEEWETMAREMERLRPLWERVHSEENIAVNHRVDQMNNIIREYRGELIYELLRTGDPSMLTLVVREIGNRVKLRQRIAFDLTAYAYLAMFDGVFNLYAPSDLKSFARELKGTAQSAQGYDVYTKMADSNTGRNANRNFADYAFHLIQMLENIDVNALPKATWSP